jgi:hypothetical protein
LVEIRSAQGKRALGAAAEASAVGIRFATIHRCAFFDE